MSKGDNTPGVSRLAGVMRAMMQEVYQAPPALDFGLIQDDFSLLTNMYPVSIPATDYLVCRGVALPNSEVINSHQTTAKNKAHKHNFEDGAVLEGATDSQSSPESHAHSVIVELAVETAAKTSGQNPHDHEVDIARPSERHLEPGDRVLVAWVENDAVVIDIIVSAGTLFGF